MRLEMSKKYFIRSSGIIMHGCLYVFVRVLCKFASTHGLQNYSYLFIQYNIYYINFIFARYHCCTGSRTRTTDMRILFQVSSSI